MTTRLKLVLFLIVLVIPAILSAVAAQVSFSRAKTVEFCGSCHTMAPWIENVTDTDSDSLASEHYSHRWIQHDQCYSCHTNYSFLGPLEAKIKGMRHVIAYYIGEKRHIELYDDFPNENCLQCHVESKRFLEDSNHEPLEDLLSGKDRCVECHEMVHGVEQEDDSEHLDDQGKEPDATEDDSGSQDGDDDSGETE